MISLCIRRQSLNLNKFIIGALAALALYAPIKDATQYLSSHFEKQTIEIVDASFGAKTAWQKDSSAYIKVSQRPQPSFAQAQIIYTRLRLTNPTSSPQTYRKIWLNFEHSNGSREYTTDYTLYNIETHQRLIGQSVQLGANSSIDVIAAYRFIPSYGKKAPEVMSVSWEGNNLMRENACEYDLKTAAVNNFHYQCKS
ncbi:MULTISPECIES: hypothetical protein [Marinomonas]|jgi:cutinase|uniref:hypothetical protein n=2 Tax=Oceanospirillaceae TaxID=135620 RepID=UPI001056772A|nr:hypothetical protein [Marinomonas sp. KMM3893]